jgi:hypothetical protein
MISPTCNHTNQLSSFLGHWRLLIALVARGCDGDAFLLAGICDVRYRGPLHVAFPAQVIELGAAVHGAAIVPDNQIMDTPPMRIMNWRWVAWAMSSSITARPSGASPNCSTNQSPHGGDFPERPQIPAYLVFTAYALWIYSRIAADSCSITHSRCLTMSPIDTMPTS